MEQKDIVFLKKTLEQKDKEDAQCGVQCKMDSQEGGVRINTVHGQL